jgi:hypothetical protein
MNRWRHLLAWVIVCAASPVTAQQSAPAPASTGAGVIEGRVTDAGSGNPLPGAQVVVTGSAAEASTDRDGRYRLGAVPAGDRTVVVVYLGRQDATVDVKVVSGATQTADVQMKMVGFEETVTVEAPLIRDAQERALNQQRTAPNITNIVSADQIGAFPDRNAAETTQRVPGVSITKDQGEGRFVIVRGTEPRLNSMMIDGQRIPAPDPLIRQVAVDVVPSELLQSIEVSKALTPDMDADSIGGSVNLVMKLGSARSDDHDDDVPADERELRAERHADVDRSGQRPGQPAERRRGQLQLQLAAARHQLLEGPRRRRSGERADAAHLQRSLDVVRQIRREVPRQTEGARSQREHLHDLVAAEVDQRPRDRVQPAALSRRTVQPRAVRQPERRREHPQSGADDHHAEPSA